MKTLETTNLLESFQLNGLTLENRIVMAPMTRSRAINNLPNDLMATYYAQRSSAGLIITEGTAPSPNGLGYARTPGIYNLAQIEGWRKITRAVHAKGSKIFLQIMHVGRVAHPANQPEGSEIIAPSAIAPQEEMWTDTLGIQPIPTPREMSQEDITKTVNEFTQASINAIDAGFDGIELHGANGYLIEQFLNPLVNTRTDLYGGSAETRSRFLLEIVNAVSQAIGKEKVGVRISPYSNYNEQPFYTDTFNTYDYLSKELDKLGILYIHLVDYAALAHEDGPSLLKRIRENFKNTLILNGGYDKERAEDSLSAGKGDLISFGKPFIANPDFPERLKKGISLKDADAALFYTDDAKGYIDYQVAI